MSNLNFIAVVAADLNKGVERFGKAEAAYRATLITAHDTLVQNGVVSVQVLRDKGEMRDAWLVGIAAAYLTKREFAAWRAGGPLRSKELETEGNTQGLTEKGKLNNRVSKRSTDIVKALESVFAAEGATGEEKAEAAKKGAKANAARDLKVRIAEELSKLIKAVDTDAAKEAPTIKRHGEVKKALETAADAIAAILKR